MASVAKMVLHLAYIKSSLSVYSLVAYQIKGNEAWNTMLGNILPTTHILDL